LFDHIKKKPPKREDKKDKKKRRRGVWRMKNPEINNPRARRERGGERERERETKRKEIYSRF